MTCHDFWPDLDARHCDPGYYEKATPELIEIIKALITLNQTGIYTVFFQYWAHIGCLEICMYEGRWNHTKKPTAKYRIDCRKETLSDADTDEPVTAQSMIEKMILVVQ